MTDHELSSALEQLDWFKRNLEFQLDDHELTQRDVNIINYWDTADVRRAILGIEDLLQNEEPDIDEMNKQRTLVSCLATAGWLGSIRLLEPHQAELAKSLRNGFGLGGRITSEARILEAFAALDVTGGGNLQLSGFASKSPQEQASITAKYAGQAPELFKAVQCTTGSWKSRLWEMYSNGFLDVAKPDTTDYSDVFSSDVFQRLREHLDQSGTRSGRSINNVTDATCICLLQRQVENYNKNGQKGSIPRFFDSRSSFNRVSQAIKEPDAPDPLSYIGFNGQQMSILRDADYYVFQASFARQFHPDANLAPGVSFDALKKLHETVCQLMQDPGKMDRTVIDNIFFSGNLIDLIYNLKNYWFLENIWLRYMASDAISKTALHLEFLASNAGERTAFEESVTREIDKTTRTLTVNSDNFRWSRDFWKDVTDYSAALRDHVRKSLLPPGHRYRALGVDRFGVPRIYRDQIETIIDGLIWENSEDFRRELTRLSKLSIEGRDPEAVAARTVVLSVLWILELHTTIQEMRIDFKSEPSWLVGIAAASAMRAGRVQEARTGLREIENRFRVARTDASKADLATIAAYLHFHLWIQEGGVPFSEDTKQRTGVPVRTVQDGMRRSIQSAIEYADLAYTGQTQDDEKKAYALNLVLFYTTEGGTYSEFLLAEKLSHDLRRFRDSGVWQYRFDDTLARYVYRRSTLISDGDIRRKQWNIALNHIEAAKASSPGDKRVDDFHEFLLELLHPMAGVAEVSE